VTVRKSGGRRLVDRFAPGARILDRGRRWRHRPLLLHTLIAAGHAEDLHVACDLRAASEATPAMKRSHSLHERTGTGGARNALVDPAQARRTEPVTPAVDGGETLDIEVDAQLEGDLAHVASALDLDDPMLVDERDLGHGGLGVD
jgi:hypothetical protein